jgi:hypothetical protein
VRTRIPSAALLLLVFMLFLAGCGGGGDQSGNGGSQDGGAPGGEEQQQGGAPQQGAAPAPKIALGTVVSVKPDKRKIFLRPTAEVQGGERMTFKVRKNAEITLDDKAAEMADVKEGQEAQIQYVVKNEVNRARSVALISGGQ